MSIPETIPGGLMTNTFDADDRFWDDVLDRVDRFSRAWEAGSGPPEIDPFLPSPGTDSRAVTLVELIKIDLEQRWQTGDASMSVAAYAQRYPELANPDGIPVDLLYEEFHLRQQYSHTASIAEYVRDYPQQAADLRRLMNVDHPLESTTLRGGQATIDVEAGETLGEFELLAELGKGAFAKVFLARQASMQRLVAVKISADRGREPQTLAQLDHPHIVRVYDQRQLTDRKLRLLYMQYVPGGTLQDVLARLKTFPRHLWSGQTFLNCLDGILEERGIEPPDDSRQRARLATLDWCQTVCILGRQLAEALHYAHGRGILHRDIKPANTLVSESASPQLVDFNISFSSTFEGTSAGAYFGGSLAYMSPEQLDACNPKSETGAETLDARSDVYALGMVLWEMLIGRRPFDDAAPSGNWSATLQQLSLSRNAGVPQDKWDALPLDVTPAFKRGLEKCLAPDRAQRFVSAGHLADHLKLAGMPEAYELLSPPHTLFQKIVGKAPITMLLMAVIIPNAIASWLNYRFNLATLDFANEAARHHYNVSMIVLNSVAFPLGICWGVWLMYRIAREVKRRLEQEPLEAAATSTRHRCLRLGRYLALVGICEWTLAGFIFPVVMRILGTPLDLWESFIYPLSLVAAGAWGAVVPFFLGTKMLVEVWYPALLRPQLVGSDDLPAFVWVEQSMRRYLLIPAAIPLFSLFILTWRGDTDNHRHMIVLSLGGCVLFGIAYAFWRTLQRQLQVLQKSAAS